MKKIFAVTGLISLTGCFLLLYLFNYNLITVAYHLSVIVIIHIIVLFVNLIISCNSKPRIGSILLNTFNFCFLFLLIFFYLSALGSNAFWGKTITLKILGDYIFSVHDFIAVLPVQGWIFYAGFVVLLLILILLFILVRPKYAYLSAKYRHVFHIKTYPYRFAAVFLVLTLLTILFRHPIMGYKRTMHFSEEPILEFVFGTMWNPESRSDLYSVQRQKNSLKDRECIKNVEPSETGKKPHATIVVLVDGLRSDHLPMYGYSRMTAPFLDSLSKAGQLLTVSRAFSTSSGTLIGVAGLFSSKDWDDFAYTGLNLMKFMNRTNHKTYAFLTGSHRTWYGLTAIYKNDCNVFYESTTASSRINLDDLTTLSEIQNTPLDKNSFIYIHLLSTHNVGKKNDRFKQYLPDKIGIGVDKKTALVNNYDNGILQMDYFTRNLFAKLREDGLLENCSVYIVADHGELFGEFDQWSHARNIYPWVISIPMLIYDSDLKWYKNKETATLKDVAPTVADRLGYPIPSCWQGHSLGKPPQDFSTKINIEIKCDLPEGILTAHNGDLTLNVFDEKKRLKMKSILLKDSANWRLERIEE